ncbi:hypothetical protein N7493_007461 [Penicillium malachiteum]|uniref:Protein kinase domain-containing protein n=1 Tax=Penicillium malachiteum TaxID=1324776 RepID=A0AAD6MU45_9EURO|nr:hypothetical protein N7493_007461 [Penicillium malachiteum]
MASDSPPDYQKLWLAEKKKREHAEELIRPTTFMELLSHCHNLFSLGLKAASPRKSTKGTINNPSKKLCPIRLRPWTECNSQKQDVYNRKNCVEGHVGSVISELCQIPAAQTEFLLAKGVYFDDHPNSLTETHQVEATDQSKSRDPKPDHFWIQEFDDGTNNLILVAEYKSSGWTSADGALRAELLTSSALVQIYDAMIEKGREYGVLINGMARVLLWVPSDDPATLFYHLCDPNSEVVDHDQGLQQPITSIARLLCLCLMSIRSPTRSQEWRISAASQAKRWETTFNRAHSSIPIEELQQSPLRSDSSSGYEASSPLEPSTTDRRAKTRSQTQAGCAPSNDRQRTPSPDSSGSDSNQAMARKRGFSQVTSSPSTQRVARQRESSNNQSNQARYRNAQFCSQRCLMGLQTGDNLDEECPNVELHRRGQPDCTKHLITSEKLVLCLKAEFDENIDRCIPIGEYGSYGAPFKLTYLEYGYTVIGKGTISDLWDRVSREVQVYQILRKAQGSAVPVFLGTIDLAKTYYLDGAGPIRHMLVMGFAGERMAKMDLTPELKREIQKSNKEIESLGIIHDDLRRENVLWCEELKRALIIDFHGATLKSRPSLQKSKTKRRSSSTERSDVKRLRV